MADLKDFFLGTIQRSFATIGYAGGLLAIVVSAVRLNSSADRAAEVEKAFNADIPALRSRLQAVETHMPYTNELRIQLPANQTHASVRIHLHKVASRNATAWAEIADNFARGTARVQASLEAATDDATNTDLVLLVETDGGVPEVHVKWLVAF